MSALVRAKGNPDTEPDCSPDQTVTGAAVMHPRSLIAPPWISTSVKMERLALATELS